MSLTKLKIGVVACIASAGVVLSLAIQHRAEIQSREKDRVLHQQAEQLAALAAEHERLSNVVAQAEGRPPDAQWRELQRPQSEAEQLRQQIKDIERRLDQSRRLREAQAAAAYSHPPGYDYPAEYRKQENEMTAGKRNDAELLSRAFWTYYRDHQYQFPSNLDQLAAYLLEKQQFLTGTNEFEMIYVGTPAGLTNFPTQIVAVIRERQAWLAPSGRWARVYGMLTVPPRIVESDDNFAAWEVEHIIPPSVSH
jgi:hypothetical protein